MTRIQTRPQTRPQTHRRLLLRTRPLTLAAVTTVLVGVLSACGGSDAATAPGQDATAGSAVDPLAGDTAAGGRQAGFPGTGGIIAAVDAKTLQVQNEQSGQVAVTYTADTAVTAQVAGTSDDIAVGTCVQVVGAAAADDAGTVTAQSVTLTDKVDGACAAQGGAFAGERGQGDRPGGERAQGERPEGELPEGERPQGDRGVGGALSGEVSAWQDGALTVQVVAPGSTATTATAVLLDDATTVLTTEESDPASLVVGACVVATGEADSTGAVSADSIVVSDAVDGACPSVAGAGRGPGGRTDATDAS